ncbi:MAG TPA: bacillithiol biosynthesis cysteine-adding enzyme BshC [Vicinamibacteria bacterium]|nr:bacillithiol biosynthesis cysteine-adding enzyme BshC [Vicinamibacteria bacterium]
MTEGPDNIIDFGAFQQPLSPLFRDYLTGGGGIGSLFGGVGFDLDATQAAAERAVLYERPRGAVADALARQQRGRGAERAAEASARLADPKTVAIVTGQQAGLFGGPLFVLWKALGAIKAARALEARRGAPVVPVFWVATDDHDFAEIRSASLLDEGGTLRTLRYSPVLEPSGQPASRIVLDATVTSLVEETRAAARPGLHKDGVLDLLGSCYRPGETMGSAFARFLSSLFPELVVLDPADPALKSLMVPLLAREIREGSPTSRLAMEAGERLLAAGYHQQVPVRPGFLNLFVVMEGERRALGMQNGTVEVRGLGRLLSVDDAVRALESSPADWSPGALLRPVVQDALLPTAAYVAGPAEIAYHAQIVPSYTHFGVPRPVLLPRPSVTLVEPAQARTLEAEGLKLTDLQGDPEAVVARWAREAYPEVEAAFARARETVESEMKRVEDALAAIDPTLRGAADAARGRALHPIGALHEKSLRALKKRDQARADRLRRTRDALFPGGAFQERGLSFVGLLARHGLPLLADAEAHLDPWARGHQVILL